MDEIQPHDPDDSGYLHRVTQYQLCSIEDSSEVLADKITAFLEGVKPVIIKNVAEAARQSQIVLTRKDRPIQVCFSFAINMMHHAYGEYLLPRAIIHPDETKLLHVRELIDKSITMRTIGANNDDVDPAIPEWGELPDLVREQITPEVFDARVAGDAGYCKLAAAMKLGETLIEECEQVAARSCGSGCGFGAYKKCSGPCGRYYCRDSCLQDHVDAGRCKAP